MIKRLSLLLAARGQFTLRAGDGVRLGYRSSALGNGHWTWTVYIGGDSESLAGVKCVRYIVEPPTSEAP